MEITQTTIKVGAPVTVFRLDGALDSASAGFFTEEARKAIESGATNILLDFSNVPFMSSVGIRSLSAIYDWLHPIKSAEDQRSLAKAIHDGDYQAPHLKLLNPNTKVLAVIELVALDRYLQVFYDEKNALEAFKDPGG